LFASAKIRLDGCILWNAHNTVFGSKRVFYTECADQGNDTKLIPTVKIKTRHPVERSCGSEFPAICNHCWVLAAGSLKTP